uniref:Uncharacterized protein n=1 Tax=Aegilops tauschii subsp. strangulata TaxID=200361 RepID=A0A453Q5U9_AEGTS
MDQGWASWFGAGVTSAFFASPPARVTRSLPPSIACVRLTPPLVRVLCSRSGELLLVARGRLINPVDFTAGRPCLN